MVKTAAVLVGSLIALAACGSTDRPRVAYGKAGVSDADRKRDESQCATSAVTPSRSDMTLGMLRLDRDLFDACMKARGYTPRPAAS